MELIRQDFGDAALITVHGKRIDAAGAIHFKDQMRAHIQGGPARIILDLGEVEFVDSSGLGAIVTSMKQLANHQVLELATLRGAVEKVFHLTRMDSVFTIHADSGAAISDLRKTG